ncbi:MAG: sulfite exporter TauE/SafE family protein [Sulfuriflexus sp.]|nr:sulfite exporter TauE/SafE family protein [Sulfuriflexus sp.]
MLEWASYLLLGAFAGTMAGLLGVGGGLIIVPVLVFIFTGHQFPVESIVHIAVGTSLASIVMTSISSTWAHQQHAAVLWPVFWQLTPGIILGVFIGAVIADFMNANSLRTFFGVFELLVAAQMAMNIKPAAHRQLPNWQGTASAGSGIGIISSIVGIGGGTLTVPFLIWCNTNMHKAIATSAACGLPIAVAGAIAYTLTGLNEANLPEGAMGYIYWPAFTGIIITSILFAPLGARLAHRLPVAVLKKVFAVLLAVLGLRMLMQ